MNTNKVWLSVIAGIMHNGNMVSPRGQNTLEMLGFQSSVDMSRPVVTLSARNINQAFLFGEAWWILSGSNRVCEIEPYMKAITNFSDNGLTFRGAYGPQVTEQLDYVVESLREDKDSRQAVLTIWRQNPRPSKDIPCTVAMQWFIRDNKLHCTTTMRSSDLFLGWVYDVFNFSCVSAYVAIALRQKYPKLELGDLILTAGSQHIYQRNFDAIQKCIDNPIDENSFDFSLFDLQFYSDPEDFIEELKERADAARK